MVVAAQAQKDAWMPLIGIPVGGLLWSIAIVAAQIDQVTGLGVGLPSVVVLVIAGGMAQTVALWVGFSAIVWSMLKGLGNELPLLNVLRLMSGASWPLWLAAPAVAFWFSGADYQTPLIAVICLGGLSAFFILTGKAIAEETGGSIARSLLAMGIAVAFMSSFIYLNI